MGIWEGGRRRVYRKAGTMVGEGTQERNRGAEGWEEMEIGNEGNKQ